MNGALGGSRRWSLAAGWGRLTAPIENGLDRWIRGRSFQAALLYGGLGFAGVMCVLSYAGNAWFMAARNKADQVGVTTVAANVGFLKMRNADTAFLLLDFVSPQAQQISRAEHLQRHQELTDSVAAQLELLPAIVNHTAREQVTRAVAAQQRYDEAFRQLFARIDLPEAPALLLEQEQQALIVSATLEQVMNEAIAGSQFARNAMAGMTVFIALLSVTLAGLFLYWFARSLSRPLQQLSAAAASIGAGNLDTRVSLVANNELGGLVVSFNQMVDALARLVGQVQKSGISIAGSVNQIAATVRQQQATSTEVAATTMEVGATSREIAVTAKELVRTVGAVAEVAEQSAGLAGSGQAGLLQMEETMRQVVAAAAGINEKLMVLSAKAGNISQVIVTITKVADQTNLLSLNAAIEAEKAGEYGRGFAVVATEIRRLADQTAVATFDIGKMVKEIQSAVSASVMGMDRFSEEVRRGMQGVQQIGTQLSQIIHQVQTLAPRFVAVNEGMQAQATGADQITQALTQLSEAAQQTVESLRQSAQAIDGLNEVAGDMRGSVSRFRLEGARDV